MLGMNQISVNIEEYNDVYIVTVFCRSNANYEQYVCLDEEDVAKAVAIARRELDERSQDTDVGEQAS